MVEMTILPKVARSESRLQFAETPCPAEEANCRLIDVQGLSVSYYSRHQTPHQVLKNITFHISAGEMVGILGTSGVGKSTLALALMGLLPRNACTTGTIQFAGRDLRHLDETGWRRIRGDQMAFIFQEPAAALNPVMRAGDQVSEVLRAHRKWDRKRRNEAVKEIFTQVGLPDADRVFSAYPHELSGGEQQRVAIGQALACQPALLIADEPASSLDTIRSAEVFAWLKAAKARLNLAILLITHDPTTLANLADRVFILDNGELARQSTVSEVLEQPVHLLTNAVRRGLASTPHSSGSLDEQPTFCTVTDPMGDPGRPGGPRDCPLLVSRQIYKRYEKRERLFGSRTRVVQALNGAGVTLRRRRTTCLVGESGSGKSTLARCMSMLERTDSGEIYLDGVDLLRLPSAEMRRRRRNIQLVMQNVTGAFSPSLTSEAIMAEPLKFSGLQPAARNNLASLLMEQVGLPASWRRRTVQELSGGQRQRLAIARALAASPIVMIFDEALNGLDLPVQAEMIELLLRLRELWSLSYLFITHNLRLARYIADDVAVMYKGEIVESGSAADVFEHPRHIHTQSLLDSVSLGHVIR